MRDGEGGGTETQAVEEQRGRPVIRFSHNYDKLRGQAAAILLHVQFVDVGQLSPAFIAYDTVYTDGRTGDTGRYELPKSGGVLVLLFLGENMVPFTTIRPWNADKEEYYRELVGTMFDVKVADDGKPIKDGKW